MFETYKKSLQHFEGPNMDNDGNRLNAAQIDLQQRFTARANAAYAWVRHNGFPENYQESAEFYKELFRVNNAGTINLEDLYALDQAISQTVWASDTFTRLGIPKVTMEKPRFEIKNYLVQSEQTPGFTTNFRNPAFISLKESSAFTNGIGLNLGISIPFTEIVESNGALWSPQSVMMQELASKMGVQKSRRGFLGTACQGAVDSAGGAATSWGITGIFNYGSKQTQAAGIGADENVQDQGDMEFTIKAMFTKLKNVYQPGKFVIVSTSGVASHLFNERDTYQQVLDLTRVKEILNSIKEFQGGSTVEWWVSDQLYAAAASSTHQQIMIAKVGPATMNHQIIYGTQMLPMANKTYERDIQENCIFADIFQVKKADTTNNAVPIVTNNADMTADGVGWLPEGTRIF